jgi:hypothetical protein
MAPPLPLLVLHEKKDVDSTSKYVTDVQYNAPPSPVDVMDLNKQFETYKLVFEEFSLEMNSCELKIVGFVVVK